MSEKHVRMAQEKIETDSMVECVSTLPTQSKAVLYAMLILERMGKRIFTSGEVTVVYREIARIIDLDVLTHRRITDLISEPTCSVSSTPGSSPAAVTAGRRRCGLMQRRARSRRLSRAIQDSMTRD